jgi:hypothetical protein
MAYVEKIYKRYFTLDEDRILLHFALINGPHNWRGLLPLLPGRSSKQCRERWNTHLNPSINQSPWTYEEDLIIAQKQQVLGNKWAEIARFLINRTDAQIKNRWNTYVKAKAGDLLRPAEPPVPGIDLFLHSVPPPSGMAFSRLLPVPQLTTLPPLHIAKT